MLIARITKAAAQCAVLLERGHVRRALIRVAGRHISCICSGTLEACRYKAINRYANRYLTP